MPVVSILPYYLMSLLKTVTAQKMSNTEFFLAYISPYFWPLFFQSKYGKIRTRINSVFGQFLHKFYQYEDCENENGRIL